jgi:alpha-glucosidase
MSDTWRQGAVLYHIYPRSFRDSNGDGIGDLAGITEKLDYVASLGVDGIWLSPFFASPMRDFGYDVSDYRAVDPVFGTLDDFDRLIARAHGLGLKVILDMVWGHSSDRHPWFIESRGDRINPKSDWYVWADPKPDGTPPNNWLSVFGGAAWSWDARRRQYYLHHFLKEQPKLNLRNSAVVAALLDAGTFWLDRGADGFRMDAVDFMVHDAGLRDNPPDPAVTPTPLRPFSMQVHRYDRGDPAVYDVLASTRALLDRYPGSISIAEVGSVGNLDNAFERAAGYVGGEGRRLHAAYTLHVAKGPGDLRAIRTAMTQSERSFDQGSIVWSFSNHDVERVASRWGDGSPDSAKVFLALLATMRGAVTLYQGEELGLPEADVPFALVQDPFGRTFWPDYRGRDGCRTPMPWERAAPNAGFSHSGQTWLPVSDAHVPLAVDQQDHDSASVLTTWRALMRMRRDRQALRLGSLHLLDAPDPLLAFERRHDRERLLCLFNLGTVEGHFPMAQRSLPLMTGRCTAAPDSADVVLPPRGYFVAMLPGAPAPV